MNDGRIPDICDECGYENRFRPDVKAFKINGMVVKEVPIAGAGMGGRKCVKCDKPLPDRVPRVESAP